MPIENGRSLAGVVNELKDEAKEFIQTRIAMLKSEMQDKVSSWKTAAMLIAVAALLGLTAWFLLTASLVSILAAVFYPSRYAYFLGFIIVGVVYLLIAAIVGSAAARQIKKRGVMPERTIRVLKQDQVWIQSEARQQV
ncbi:MAG TPA: phage holin family protein [Terriglobales bacterium]|nr:phage holin family protein [Terriglobales bacterium]